MIDAPGLVPNKVGLGSEPPDKYPTLILILLIKFFLRNRIQLEGMGDTPILCESKLTELMPGNLKSDKGK